MIRNYQNIRENGKINQKWTIQRHWQGRTHKTQNEDKQNKNITQQHGTHHKRGVNPGSRKGLASYRHRPCYMSNICLHYLNFKLQL